jgi:hypothetical protein
VWRVVLAKVATLEEIGRSWTLLDLVDAHLALDVQEDLDRILHAGRKS